MPYCHALRAAATTARIMPAAPFSSECTRLQAILRIVALYRLSFRQPRQQELIESLLIRACGEADLNEIRRALLIDLAPIHYLAWPDSARGCGIRDSA